MACNDVWLCDSCGAAAVKEGECKALGAYYLANEIPFMQGTCARCSYYGALMPYPVTPEEAHVLRNENLLIIDLLAIYRQAGSNIYDKLEVISILTNKGFFTSAEAVARMGDCEYDAFLYNNAMS